MIPCPERPAPSRAITMMPSGASSMIRAVMDLEEEEFVLLKKRMQELIALEKELSEAKKIGI